MGRTHLKQVVERKENVISWRPWTWFQTTGPFLLSVLEFKCHSFTWWWYMYFLPSNCLRYWIFVTKLKAFSYFHEFIISRRQIHGPFFSISPVCARDTLAKSAHIINGALLLLFIWNMFSFSIFSVRVVVANG